MPSVTRTSDWTLPSFPPLFARMARIGIVSLVVSTALVGLLLLVLSQVSGTASYELPVSLALAALCSLLLMANRRLVSPSAVQWVGYVPVLLFGIVVSASPAHWTASLGYWLLAAALLVIEHRVEWRFVFRPLETGSSAEVLAAPAENESAQLEPAVDPVRSELNELGEFIEFEEDESFEEEAEELLPASATQYWTRAHTELGGEVVQGMLRATFEPQQRQQNLHLSFCPALEMEPSVTTYQMEGPEATVSVADRRAYGLRFEVRLSRAHPEPTNVLIQFEAVAEPAD